MNYPLAKSRTKTNGVENRLATASRIFDLDAANQPPPAQRSLMPTLIIAGGGMGTGIARRIKWHLNRYGANSYHSFLVLDTDETSQSSEGEFPGFEDHEFTHLSIDRCRDILRDPSSHQLLANRLNLFDEANRTKLWSILDRGLDQAGQVRPIGVIAFYANLELIRERIQHQIRSLLGYSQQFERQLNSNVSDRLRPRLRICLTGSLAGGTYSSFFIDLAALIRHELLDNSIQLNGYYILPNALDTKLAGKSVERIRVRANAYSAITSLDALEDGYGAQRGLQFGVTDTDGFPASTILHNQIYLAERLTADGRDLETPEAIQDKIALSIAGEISTELGDQLEAADHNDVTRQNLAPDPATGRSRRFSTLSASAIGVQQQKMTSYGVSKQLRDVAIQMLGPTWTTEESQDKAQEFLRENDLGDDGKTLGKNLRSEIVPNLDSYVQPLFKVNSPNGNEFHANRKTAELLQAAQQRFLDTHLPKLEKHHDKLRSDLLQRLRKSLKRQAGVLVHSVGFRAAQSLLSSLSRECKRLVDAWTMVRSAAQARQLELDKQLTADREQLVGILQGMRTNRPLQELIISKYRQYLQAVIDTEIARGLVDLLQGLQSLVAKYDDRMAQSIKGYEDLDERAENSRLASTPSEKILTTASTCEIDMSSIEVFEAFYASNKLDCAELLKVVASKCEVSEVELREKLFRTDQTYFSDLQKQVRQHFNQRVNATTIASIFDYAFKAGGQAEEKALIKLREAVRATQPMWQSEPGQVAVRFGDTIVLGVPQGTDSETRERLLLELNKAAATLRANTRYTGDPSIVTISDPHRILILRRSHGGRPHYLRCWQELKSAADVWSRNGGHSVDTFAREFMSSLPSIDPVAPVLPVDEAFALALAYGWVAKRGPEYYLNLATNVTSGTSSFAVATVSEWEGLAFQSSRLRPSVALRRLIDSNQIQYSASEDFHASQLLAGDVTQAQRNAADRPGFIPSVLEVFKQLRVAAGDPMVIQEMNQYLVTLSQRLDSTGPRDRFLCRQMDVIKHISAKLSKGV